MGGLPQQPAHTEVLVLLRTQIAPRLRPEHWVSCSLLLPACSMIETLEMSVVDGLSELPWFRLSDDVSITSGTKSVERMLQKIQRS